MKEELKEEFEEELSDACRYCGKGLTDEDVLKDACNDCGIREGLLSRS